ncbi:myosin light chain kinase, smooth muscle-like isoform X1 [Acropora millepora]|uniref:myosin light chain kinase, smooth muscle-like isoform X1 n=2 Tax=Acropora millepora TaxID=45264 RepID=UPI001CF4F957|nr:myosin light chain kinase, smooth muscle-like isoform X1 [Acropora millepora]
MDRRRKISNHKPISVYSMERERKNRTVADLNVMNIVAAEMVDEKKHSAESEEAEEEEFVKYGAVDEFYNLDKEIGKGAYGVVKKCVHKENGNIFAAKIIKTSNSNIRKSVMQEIEMMRAVGRHSKIVELFDAYQTPFEIVMVLEFVPGGELFERIVVEEYLMEDDAVDYVKQLLEALHFMHEKNIVHLDLKPENILCVSMDSNDIKLVDFGLARNLDAAEETKSSFGTPDFVAPEVVRLKPVSSASDLWSLGVVTYVLLSGLMPFSGEDDHQTLVKVAKADWDFDDDCFDDLSHDAMEFIEGLLVKDPSKRFTIKECFEHPWIKETKDTGTKINTQKHKAFMAKRRWKKSVNALLAVRRMSLSPLFAAKRRSSMDPSILKSASESEEEHVVDRKVSEPIDPAGLSIPNRRHGETRSSCFDLDMNTIKALREKADKALGRVLLEKADNNDGDITCQKDSDDKSSHSSEGCADEVDEEELQTKNCDNSASCSYQRQRANTFCGERAARKEASKGERKTSAISSVGNNSRKDFKRVSSTFNAEDLHKNNKLVCESTTVHNTLVNEANARDYRMEKDFALSQELCQFSPERSENCTFEPNNSKSLLDESRDTSGTDNTGDELPQICINDHLMVTSSPPPISVTLNNNIENTDKNSIAIGSTQSLQISPSLNIITSGNKLIGDGAQSISVKLGNLNGVQITCDHVTPSARRASTGSASC